MCDAVYGFRSMAKDSWLFISAILCEVIAFLCHCWRSVTLATTPFPVPSILGKKISIQAHMQTEKSVLLVHCLSFDPNIWLTFSLHPAKFGPARNYFQIPITFSC